jgi:hypothetical protein
VLWILPIAVVAVVISGVAIAVALSMRQTGRVYLVALAVALAVLACVTVLFWRHAILAVAIFAVCLIGLTVIFGQTPPKRAIIAAFTGFILLFVFTWLAQQLSATFLYETEPEFIRRFREQWLPRAGLKSIPLPLFQFLTPVGIGCLLASIAARKTRPLWLLAGTTLVLVTAPAFLAEYGFCFEQYEPIERWVVALAIVLLAIAIAVRAAATTKDTRTR